MVDVVCVLATLLTFVLATAYVSGCDRLKGTRS